MRNYSTNYIDITVTIELKIIGIEMCETTNIRANFQITTPHLYRYCLQIAIRNE